MTGIVDYNAGNIKSVERALDAIKAPYIISKKPSDLANVDRLIFPGVGEAKYAMEQLKLTGFDSFLKDWTQAGKPLMGICLGSQIIFDYSEEGDTKCLGLVAGTIRHFKSLWKERLPAKEEMGETGVTRTELKVPQIGWNDVKFMNGSSPLLNGVDDSTSFYFVHSYVIQPDDPTVIKGVATYGTMVPAIIEYGNITAFQFHPEKSGEPGLRILRNFTAPDTDGGKSC